MSDNGGLIIGKDASAMMSALNELSISFSIGYGHVIVSKTSYEKLLERLGQELLDSQNVITRESFQELMNDHT